ncbi:MAG: hypothetical protein ACOY42_10395 [Pseudomonadota bacterium]
MIRGHRLQVCILALLFAALLVGPVSGAHLHLCLDGAQPPAGLHLFEVGQHHGEFTPDQGHSDVEVMVLGELIAKGKGEGQLPLFLLAAAVLLILPSIPRGSPMPRVARFIPSPLPFLRPPLCGPPR